jgi:phage FluMu protein Com
MAFKFRCTQCGKRLTANEPPGSEVTCPHCNQSTAVPPDAEPTEGLDAAPPVEAVAVPVEAVAEPVAATQFPAPEGEEQAGGMDTVVGWLALYLPSWGTSFVLHVAALALVAFTAWTTQTVQQIPFEYKSEVVQATKPKMEKKAEKKDQPKDKPKQQQTGRGKGRPGPTSIVRQFTQNPFPDVASNNLERLEVFGVGGGGKEIGGFEGLGTGRGGFFGVGDTEEKAVQHKIVYIVDRSGSMTDSMDFVKFELKRSIGELGEENEFHVIFFSSGPPVEMPTRRLVNATERNKQVAFEFIDSVVPQGETDPSKALERAFACGADLIYLLTDGEFDKEIIGLIKRLNIGGKVTVHTIGFIYKDGEQILKEIAKENNGNYKFVSEKDLATLAQ